MRTMSVTPAGVKFFNAKLSEATPRSCNGRRTIITTSLLMVGLWLAVTATVITTSRTASAQSVPKANCGPHDRTESGLQGETTQEERFSGDSELGYNCNLELVGQQPLGAFEGAFSQDGTGVLRSLRLLCNGR